MFRGTIYTWIGCLTLAAALLGSSCCAGNENRDGSHTKILHPTPENLPSKDKLTSMIDLEGEPDERQLPPSISSLLNATDVSKVEEMTGDLYLSQIEDAAVDRRGFIYLVDRGYQQVLVLDSDSEHVADMGREGKGPGEFQSLWRVAIYKDSLLLAADRFHKVEVFIINRDEREHVGTIQTEFVPEDICVLGDELFVSGITRRERKPKVIHAYSIADYSHIRLFGEPYNSKSPFTMNQLSDGYIACSEPAGTVIFMFQHFPVIRGYGQDGELRWVTRFDGYEGTEIVEQQRDGRPSITYKGSKKQVDHLLDPVPVGSGHVLFQIRRSLRGSDLPVQKILDSMSLKTVIVEAKTGRGWYAGEGFPSYLVFKTPYLIVQDYSGRILPDLVVRQTK